PSAGPYPSATLAGASSLGCRADRHPGSLREPGRGRAGGGFCTGPRAAIKHASLNQTLGLVRRHERDVIPRMTVKRLREALLVHPVADQSDRAADNEQAIEHPKLDSFLDFFFAKVVRRPQHVNERHCDTSVDIQDQVVFLLRSNLLDLQSVVQVATLA